MGNGQGYCSLMRCCVPEGESEHWKVERFNVSEEASKFDRLRSIFSGGGLGRHTPPGDYTRLVGKHGVGLMMSDTPDELRDHLDPYLRARGTCLVNGLGLGCIVAGMLQKVDMEGALAVDKVIVVEISEEVVELVGTHLSEEYGDRLEIRCADAYLYKPPRGERYNVVWHDIWPSLSIDNLAKMTKLHRKYGRRCDWQGSWGKDLLQEIRRRQKEDRRRWV